MNNSWHQLRVWLLITSFYCFQYILRLLPNFIMPELMQKFSVTAEAFGNFAGIYYIGYISVHVPIGLLLSRYGGKLILPIAIICASSGLLPLIYGNSWNAVIIGRMMTGIGSSAAIIGAFQLFRLMFPDNFSHMLGLMVSVGLVTAVSISKPLTFLLAQSGMVLAVIVLVSGGGLLALCSYVFLPREEKSHSTPVMHNMRVVFGNVKLILVSILAGLMVGALEGFPDAWATGFLTTVYSLERATADSLVFLILIGMCVGSVVLPYISDRIKNPYGITLISALVMGIAFVLLLAQLLPNTIIIAGTFFAIGFFCAYQVVILSKIATFVAPAFSGFAGSVANMIVMSFGYFFHKTIGILMDTCWHGAMRNGIRYYDASAYVKSLSLIPLCFAIAIIGLLCVIVQERKNQKTVDAKEQR